MLGTTLQLTREFIHNGQFRIFDIRIFAEYLGHHCIHVSMSIPTKAVILLGKQVCTQLSVIIPRSVIIINFVKRSTSVL